MTKPVVGFIGGRTAPQESVWAMLVLSFQVVEAHG